MKLEAGQVWQLDTQEEFDAFVKLKDEQGIGWSYTDWTFEYLMEQVVSNRLEISIDNRIGVEKVYNSHHRATHYGKDLLKEDNMFKVGDRVKVVGNSYNASFNSGKGKVVEVVNGGDSVYVLIDGDTDTDGSSWLYNKKDLELIGNSKWQEVEREKNIGSENGMLIVEQNTETKELRVTRGCFTGTLGQFEAAVKRKPEGDKHRIVYEWLIEKYKAEYPDYKKVAYVVKLNEKSYKSGPLSHCYKKNAALIYEDKIEADVAAERCGGTVEEVEL